jgi:regulator of cell morphogenesis and NO signaling
MSLTALADHIEATHHKHVRGALCRLAAMMGEIVPLYAKRDRRLPRVQETFGGLAAELWSHMMKEEMCLFPMIRQIEAGEPMSKMRIASISSPIRQMELDHDGAGASLAILRELTDAYTVPEWACDKYRGMLAELSQFEQDLHTHIHKENDVLFPRALELEARKAQGAPVS